MVVSEQKLLKTARGPVVHQVGDPRIQQRDRVVEFDHRATGTATIVVLQTRPTAGRTVAAKSGHQLGTAGAC